MTWTSSNIPGDGGAQLQLYHHLPATKQLKTPKAIIQINHGMAEHAGRYARVAKRLADAGYGTYAHDHRGHGHTTAPGTAQGIFARKDGWNAVMADVAAVHAHIAACHPGVPVICFGHSMGSIIAFNFALRNPHSIQGLALWNSGVETGARAALFSAILGIQRMFKGSDVPSGLASKITFEAWNREFSPNRTEFDWLSRDPAEVDKYVEDPLCGFQVSIGLWLDLLRGIYFAADNRNLRQLPHHLPIHLLTGSDDPCTERGAAVENIAKRMQAIGLQDVNLEIRPQTRHECLNDINRQDTLKLLVSWLDQRFS